MADIKASTGNTMTRTLNNAKSFESPNARRFRELTGQLQTTKDPGKQTAIQSSLIKLTESMTPSDWKAARYVAAESMRGYAVDHMRSRNKPERDSAIEILALLKKGQMPGPFGMGPISIETGEPVNKPAPEATVGWQK